MCVYAQLLKTHTKGRIRCESCMQINLEQFAADQTAKCYQPLSEETPGPAPEPSNCGNELLVGSPRDFAAAIQACRLTETETTMHQTEAT